MRDYATRVFLLLLTLRYRLCDVVRRNSILCSFYQRRNWSGEKKRERKRVDRRLFSSSLVVIRRKCSKGTREEKKEKIEGINEGSRRSTVNWGLKLSTAKLFI